MIPAMPAISADRMNAIERIRFTRIPVSRAASRLPPVNRSRRPNGVYS